ncbi:MAG: deaminase [Candidatus Pacebacteria bacterium]|jgi:deoxycytidylate deaminase|nr:deaminase [Candidatus Paceibacterota bacterium]
MSNIVIAFIPVLHRGYLDFLKQSGAKDIYLLSAEDTPELSYLSREMRALHFDEVEVMLSGYGFRVYRFSSEVERLKVGDFDILMPDEDITRAVYKKHFEGKQVKFINTFLRWDWAKSTAFTPVAPEADRVLSIGDIEAEIVSRNFRLLFQELTKSSDWWRQVSAMAVCKSGEVIVAYNKHFPNEYVPYIDGDPRNNFGPGEFIEVSSALHGEIAVIAEAARQGVSLEDADLLVTTFPCCGCAAAVSVSGVQRVFFTGGYSNLNGVKDLRDRGIEIIYVEL